MRSHIVALLLLLTQTTPTGPPPPRFLIPDEGLGGWVSEPSASQCAQNAGATVTIAECAGWFRTSEVWRSDFELTFEARRHDARTGLMLGVLGRDDVKHAPEAVVTVPLLGSPLASRPSKRLALTVSSAAARGAMKPDDEWQSFIITRNRLGLHALLNGTEILASEPIRSSDGWIGFQAFAGRVDIRLVRIRYLAPPAVGTGVGPGPVIGGQFIDGAYFPGRGVTVPKVLRQVRPNYTREALGLRIEGEVVLDCVVEPNGTIERVTVVRSLDDRYGLDEEAVKAARAWRFEPGVREGVPVPVRIRIALTFKVEK